jgi:hypothetical protein
MMIYYEPHPVTPERKRELRSKGYQIVDAAFAPADWKAPDGIQAETETPTEAKPVKRGRPRKAD